MVAHPHIVRCMQVLETRRQQVRAQPAAAAAVPRTAGASASAVARTARAGAHRGVSQLQGLERAVCFHRRAGAGAGAPVWWGDAAAAAAHETVHGGQRLPDFQAGEGAPTAGLLLTPLRKESQSWLRACLRQPHRGQGRSLLLCATTKAAGRCRRARAVLLTACTSATHVCCCRWWTRLRICTAWASCTGTSSQRTACWPSLPATMPARTNPSRRVQTRHAQHVSCGMCRHRFPWAGRRSVVTLSTAATQLMQSQRGTSFSSLLMMLPPSLRQTLPASNTLLLPCMQVKLIDLGMAGLYRPNKPVHGCMGSPGFIAPEVILGEPHTV